MQVQLPIFLLSLVVHAGIFLTSQATDRRLRLMAGLTLVFCTWPAWYRGMVMTTSPGGPLAWLSVLLIWAPYYLPVLSFLVYWRGKTGR